MSALYIGGCIVAFAACYFFGRWVAIVTPRRFCGKLQWVIIVAVILLSFGRRIPPGDLHGLLLVALLGVMIALSVGRTGQ